MPKAGEFKGAKSVFLNAAMSVVEEKETSESALKALDEISASEETPDILKSVVSYLKEQNKEKTDLIAQFGRDPRLNDLLGRENSEEETVWLKEKGFIKADTAKQEEEKEAE
uniref:Uncharacterized protein n=1 Tax=Norrisiella sphaerica TaxID=552664 RepID=A0A7S2QT85_9EUKA